jgi:hypothetical protein
MESGTSFWMTNLWLATSTDLSWNAWMGSGGDSIRVYSHIRQIILKSESMIYNHRAPLAEASKTEFSLQPSETRETAPVLAVW